MFGSSRLNNIFKFQFTTALQYIIYVWLLQPMEIDIALLTLLDRRRTVAHLASVHQRAMYDFMSIKMGIVGSK